MSDLKLILPKDWLSPQWEEISREKSEVQITIKLGHIDPENKADSLLTSGNLVATVDGEAVSVHGISTRGTMTKFFETMTKIAASGWMQGYTPKRYRKSEVNLTKYEMKNMILQPI